MAPTLTEEQAALFLATNFACVAALRRDGSVHLTPVWIDWDGECVVFNISVERLNMKLLTRDPRVTICVFTLDNPYQFVTERLRRDVQRVIVRVRPERVLASGFDD